MRKMMKKLKISTFGEYQEITKKHATYPKLGHGIVFPTLGLAGESGEVSEKVKKLIRDKKGVVDDEFVEDITKELGDVLWYLSQIASEMDISLEEIASKNITKLNDRLERKQIHGDGDNR